MKAFVIFNTQVTPINKTPFTIGRSLQNHLVVQEPTISRQHAQITRDENQKYWLEDLGSTGGTYINHVRITKSVLNSGDSILLADTPIVFVDNAPQLSERAADSTSPLHEDERGREDTVIQPKPDWRPKD